MQALPSCSRPARTRLVVALLAVAAWHPLSAQAVQVEDRSAMAATDLIVWTGTLGYTTAPPFLTASQGGVAVEVSSPGGTWQTQQAGCGGSFASNFLACEQVLFTSSFTADPNPIVLNFATPLKGGGAQFSQGITYGAFTAQIAAYDAQGQLLETYTRAGQTTGAGDGSAVFLGVLRDQADIARLEFSVPTIDGWAGYTYFGINAVSLSVAPPPVPEPGTWALWLGGLALLGKALRRRG